jgi:hypothetical protein
MAAALLPTLSPLAELSIVLRERWRGRSAVALQKSVLIAAGQ